MFMHEEESEKDVLDTIKRLMEELAEKMEYNSDDFEERLGRKKPQVDISVMKGEMPVEKIAEVSDMDDMPEMDEDDDEDMDMEEGGSLKHRLMRLRKG